LTDTLFLRDAFFLTNTAFAQAILQSDQEPFLDSRVPLGSILNAVGDSE
jgi:hypothetical protein